LQVLRSVVGPVVFAPNRRGRPTDRLGGRTDLRNRHPADRPTARGVRPHTWDLGTRQWPAANCRISQGAASTHSRHGRLRRTGLSRTEPPDPEDSTPSCGLAGHALSRTKNLVVGSALPNDCFDLHAGPPRGHGCAAYGARRFTDQAGPPANGAVQAS
jgi:hypothetical protein